MADDIVEVELKGHLTHEQLKGALQKAEDTKVRKFGLLVNCMTMTGYDTDARAYFVEWHKKMQPRVMCTAIVLNQPFWQLVISAMSLASSAPMKAFSTHHDAEKWLTELSVYSARTGR